MEVRRQAWRRVADDGVDAGPGDGPWAVLCEEQCPAVGIERFNRGVDRDLELTGGRRFGPGPGVDRAAAEKKMP